MEREITRVFFCPVCPVVPRRGAPRYAATDATIQSVSTTVEGITHVTTTVTVTATASSMSTTTAILGGVLAGATAAAADMLKQAKLDVKQDLKKKPCASHFNNPNALQGQVDKTSFKNLGKLRYVSTDGGYAPTSGSAPLTQEFAEPYTTLTGQTYSYPVAQLNSSVNWVDPNNTAALLNGKPFSAQVLNGMASYVGAASMTPQQLMELTILHEMSHTKQFGKMNPDLQRNQQKLWNDCIK